MNKPTELSNEETKQVVGGSTAVEYGLISANLGVAIISTVTKVGQALTDRFRQIQGAVKK
jgi:Flp pilus assembly pilin Flp